ncbi:GreA/GreB family elongation factor [Arenibacter sp. S6351L]|uniref:GreA/GreB family elongation factor n=1 Tax=Arenibacter sp. S6351L TaxID=2926407 RepID=UPI001FF24A5B|nr:GreA/GreB family elongation factor [Arenibacter sp. S6351L]MCK0135528.1 GreA/GreB family elongation factor [Arenibacter sp. S6351L]MDX1766736.1 GreA/GreB family elongation factor [Arenibacter troitsensis]
MKYEKLIMGKKDVAMIKRYQHVNYYIEDYSHKDALEMLDENMAKAIVLDEDEMSDDIIRLNSIVTVTSKTGWSETFQLVLHFDDGDRANRFSVQCALGASVLGRSNGDIVRYFTPIGIIPLKITKVVQTENYCANKIGKDNINRVQAQIN